MSKLDDIVDDVETNIDKNYLGDWLRNNLKQSIKGLMLELIGPDKHTKAPYDLAELQKAYDNGANMLRAELRRKVAEL